MKKTKLKILKTIKYYNKEFYNIYIKINNHSYPVLLTIFFELFIKKINFIGIFFSTGFILLSAIIFIIF